MLWTICGSMFEPGTHISLTWVSLIPEKKFVYCISSYKTRGYYFFVEPTTAGIIRMWVLFEGVDYSKKVPTLEYKVRVFNIMFVFSVSCLFKLNDFNDYLVFWNLKMKTYHFLKSFFTTSVLILNNLNYNITKTLKKCLPILPAGIYRGRILLTILWHYCGHY